ncbi:hypothetical protein Bca52824_057020 [Brassica carinata]|uniref:Uncharacterized protein n=1 Tax=Brassica carinata TaxID=52824 RepID=A0A8X7QTY6_BRACI|nr:hypothetical protein Bca52824_057020 [Brassica carinata]
MVSDISQGKMTVAKYKRFFYSLRIVGERTEQQLIMLAKAGLKEEIRDGLETEEFATLEALFEEAEEVEEALHKRRRLKPDHRSSKRAFARQRKGDRRMRVMDTPLIRDGLKDDEEGDYWEWMQMDTGVDGSFRLDRRHIGLQAVHDGQLPGQLGTDSSTSDSD